MHTACFGKTCNIDELISPRTSTQKMTGSLSLSPMKKWAAIMVFLVYTFGATDAYQLLKLLLPCLLLQFK